MFTGKGAANPAYPTQWALNPNAYQNIDSSQVDWASLAQQWIAMKEAAAIISAPPPPSMKPDAEEGEAPMEVENPDNTDGPGPPGGEWNSATNSWGGNWNQWGWGWSGSGGVDSKMVADSSMAMTPMMDGYTVPPDSAAAMPGYSTGAVPAPTFQHGYWTAPQIGQESTSSRSSSRSRDRRSKSKNREHKSSRSSRDKPPIIPPVIEPIVTPTVMATPTIDAAKRRQLPAWIREGLEKMEREKQRAIEREQEKQAREEAEKEKKKFEEEELKRLKAEASGAPIPPPKSKFESDSEPEDAEKEEKPAERADTEEETAEDRDRSAEREPPPALIKRSKEEILQEVMLTVRRSLTEILLEVTDQEIQMVSQEELARYTAAQASRLNAMKAGKSKALAAIASGLGLGAYESSSDDSGDEEELNDLSDIQLQDIIKRRRLEFEKTSREIEADVRRAELREAGDETGTPVDATPDRPRRSRSSATPPPIDSDTPEKVSDRRPSKDKRNNHKSVDKVDGIRRLESIPEEKPKKSRKDGTPSPQKGGIKQKNSSGSSSDSEDDSSTSSSNNTSSQSEQPVKIETKHAKKRKRKSSSSSESMRKSKKQKDKKEKSSSRNSYSKSKYDDYEKEKSRSRRKDEHHDRHKSSKSRDEKSHKDKYREDSDEDRPRKRAKRSRSVSYESRSGRRRSRDRSAERSRRRDKRSYDREGSKRERSYDRGHYDKHDRYERSRDYGRRRSRSGSHARHRR